MPIDAALLPAPDLAGYTVAEIGDDLVLSLSKRFDHSPCTSLWAVQVVRACTGPYGWVKVDCSHQPALSSTAIAGMVRLADEYATPHGRRLLLLNANDRIRRTIAQIQLDLLVECLDPDDPRA